MVDLLGGSNRGDVPRGCLPNVPRGCLLKTGPLAYVGGCRSVHYCLINLSQDELRPSAEVLPSPL